MKNQYWIEKHRFYELKHFCRQYDIWKKARQQIIRLSSRPSDLEKFKTNDVGDPTARAAMAIAKYDRWIEMLERSAKDTDDVIGIYILEAVATGASYDTINARHEIPCGREMYYQLYHKFFYILNKLRD